MSPRALAKSAYSAARELTVSRLPGDVERWRRRLKQVGSYLGPGFLVGVGYMDPGNWGTDLEAGSRFGYRLLWVVLVSNLIAIVVQNLSARLGLVTGYSYAENCRRRFATAKWLSLWMVAELALVATDLAEFMGAMLGFELLFGVGRLAAALLSVVSVFGILALYRWGDRWVELQIMALVALVGGCYVYELRLVSPEWGKVVHGTLVPLLDGASAPIAAGILGATVMPHNLFLHSAVVRRRPGREVERAALRSTLIDSLLALNGAWLINAAILVTAAATFFGRSQRVMSIVQAHDTLVPLLGPFAGGVFALALLASGVSSSTTATLTGQIVFEGFWGRRMNLFLRRALTVAPALVVIWLGWEPFRVLIVSQIGLSVALPFTLVPLAALTARADVMGRHANGRLGNAIVLAATLVILSFNAMLLWSILS